MLPVIVFLGHVEYKISIVIFLIFLYISEVCGKDQEDINASALDQHSNELI